ncbi:hypothetical protein [Luteimonas sp. SDU82]|uniref:hypothetical protein n=1 Tax=Luteimonas sp. SDU82 TaxID=3422592 RepID=UPI003EB6FD14
MLIDETLAGRRRAICMRIQERHRQRQDLQCAEVRLTLQLKAICRRFTNGDKDEALALYASTDGDGAHRLSRAFQVSAAPLLAARQALSTARKHLEREMERDVRMLPIWPRVAATRGLGALGLASIVGEAGDLSNYSSHSKLWKRLGLAVIGGERQRRVQGAAAIAHGYSPSRRAIVWQVGSSLFRAQSERRDQHTGAVIREAGSYRLGYDARKTYERPRVASAAHAHNRASRYMEKKLIRNLWDGWRVANRIG